MDRIPLIRPRITEDMKRRVVDVIESGYWTEGPVTHELEESFQQFIGCDHALAVTSCTTGLEIALRALGVGPGDEVVVPDYTYPATASVVPIVGARVVVVDVDPETMLIDMEALEAAITEATKAIIPVSIFGNPLDADRLLAIKEKHGVAILEDGACSVGAAHKGVRTGCRPDITVFSMHPRKFITTGEGGMVTTNDARLADFMNSYKHFGMGCRDGNLSAEFERVGTNYKLSNILSAVGLAQMQEIDDLLKRRIELADAYRAKLSDDDRVKFQETTPEGIHSRQSFCIRIRERDRVMAAMRERGIEVQIGTFALHRMPAYAESEYCSLRGPFPGSEASADDALVLPLYHEMTESDQDRVVEELRSLLA